MSKEKVRLWFRDRLDCFPDMADATNADTKENLFTLEELIERMRAFCLEAELRLTNPNFPSNE